MSGTDLEPVGPDPWEKLVGEDSNSYFIFTEFCKLGPKRTLRAVSRNLGVSYDTVKATAKKHSWLDRAKEYDLVCNELVPSDNALAPSETLAFQYAVGTALLDLGIKAIKLKRPGDIKVTDAIKLVEKGADLQRKAQGLDTPGVSININTGNLDAVNDLIDVLEVNEVEDDDEVE